MGNTCLIILLSFIIVSCNKSAYTTSPQITLKSVNTTVLYPDEELTITLSLTDKEGDLSEGKVALQKFSLNCQEGNFTDTFPIPEFSASSPLKADLLISFANGVNLVDNNGNTLEPLTAACPQDNDTCFFRISTLR